jgi:hypothetical protein
VECAFGTLKRKFKVLRVPIEADANTVSLVVYSCIALYNFIKEETAAGEEDGDFSQNPDDLEEEESDAEDEDEEEEYKVDRDGVSRYEWRDSISTRLWNAYTHRVQ